MDRYLCKITWTRRVNGIEACLGRRIPLAANHEAAAEDEMLRVYEENPDPRGPALDGPITQSALLLRVSEEEWLQAGGGEDV